MACSERISQHSTIPGGIACACIQTVESACIALAGGLQSALRCRASRVEAGVSQATRTPLRGLHFQQLDDAQGLPRPLGAALGRHPHPRHAQAGVAGMFGEGRPALGPVPLDPFRYYQYGRRTVHLDGCVEVASALPTGRCRAGSAAAVHVQWNAGHMRLVDLNTGQLLGEHLNGRRGWHRIEDSRTEIGLPAPSRRPALCSRSPSRPVQRSVRPVRARVISPRPSVAPRI